MRLYFHCPKCHQKLFIQNKAKTRLELAEKITAFPSFNCPCNSTVQINVNNIYAERTIPRYTAPVSAGVLGLIGMMGGPAGVVIGALLGGGVGWSSSFNNKSEVDRFNNSFK